MIISPAKWIVLKATLLFLNFQQLLRSVLTSIHLMACFVFPKIIQARSLILSFSCFVGNPCFTFLARELNHTWSHSSKIYSKGNFKKFAGLSMKVFVIAFQVTSYICHILLFTRKVTCHKCDTVFHLLVSVGWLVVKVLERMLQYFHNYMNYLSVYELYFHLY